MSVEMKILKTISFEELDKWFVSFYLNPYTIESVYPLVKLSEVIYPRKDRISKNDYKNDIPVIKKISFKDGKIHLRDKNETGMSLYRISKNELLVSKINFHQGAISINNIGELVSSTHYQPYIINKNVSKEYLKLCLRSDSFLNFIKYLRADGIKNEATYEFIGKLKIPLPPLTEQNRIVTNYNAKIKQANEQEQKAKALEQKIEDYLFEVLGIEKLEEKEKKVLNFVKFSNLNIWGVDRLLRGNFNSVLTSSIYPNKKLNSMVYVNPRTDLTDLESEDVMSFIPMKYISDDYGIVLNTDQGKKEHSKGYTKFKDGDLLWARITPCMQNGKSAIVSDLLNGFGYGSTEYHVLRKKEDDLKLDFLYHLLRTKLIREDAVSHFTGSSGQQRVPKSYLENLTVPLPPLKTQTQIANHISGLKLQIKDLKKQANENRAKAIQEFEEEIFSSYEN